MTEIIVWLEQEQCPSSKGCRCIYNQCRKEDGYLRSGYKKVNDTNTQTIYYCLTKLCPGSSSPQENPLLEHSRESFE